MQDEHFSNALESFTNQLKETDISGKDKAMSYYFTLALHLALGRSKVAKDIFERIAKEYAERNTEEPSLEEKLWLKRLTVVWNDGVDIEQARRIE